MASQGQVAILQQGVEKWNLWRKNNPTVEVDLAGADLHGLNLSMINLSYADLSRANLIDSQLYEADFRGANLQQSDLRNAVLENANLWAVNLSKANLEKAHLRECQLWNANLGEANLQGANCILVNLIDANLQKADLTGSNLNGAVLVGTNIENARLSRCSVYGISVWDLVGQFEEQRDLIISRKDQPTITVDNIKIAQFIYLILNNEEIRDVINALTSKAVLILGRFAIPERKAMLDAMRNKLREYDLLPIVFDFDRPTDKDFTETIKTLAGISYFVIADVTNPKSSPLELQATVPDYQIPFVPIIQEGEQPFSMLADLHQKHNWVLPTRSYDSVETLMAALKPGIIDPAVEMKNKLRLVKAQEQVTESLKDYLGKTL